MPRTCTICSNPKRAEIDKGIISGTSLDALGKEFGVSRFALKRHQSHVVELVALSPAAEKIAGADVIVNDVQDLVRHAGEILIEARKGKDHRTALSAINTLKGLLEFRAQVSGALKPHQTNNLHLHLGGERGFDDNLAKLIERARLFPFDRRRETPALPASAGA